MEDGVVSFPTIINSRFVGDGKTKVIVSTRVPISIFNFEIENATISVEGSLALNFQGAASRTLTIAGGNQIRNRQLQANAVDEEATFGLSINLEPKGLSEKGGDSISASAAWPMVGLKILAIVGAIIAVYVI